MEPVRRGVHKALDTEETPMFIASQGRCWMGCDLSFCLSISFTQLEANDVSRIPNSCVRSPRKHGLTYDPTLEPVLYKS